MAEDQLLSHESGLDRLPQTHIVGDQQVNTRHLDPANHGVELVVLDGDAAPEGCLQRRPQRAVFGDLERTKQRYLAPDLDIYFDDINDASERIWQMLEGYKETVEALEQTNESVLSHRLNDVLRVLTAFSVALLPLTLIASIWGMNTHVPGEQTSTAFWTIIGVMVVLLTGLLAFFRRRGWL